MPAWLGVASSSDELMSGDLAGTGGVGGPAGTAGGLSLSARRTMSPWQAEYVALAEARAAMGVEAAAAASGRTAGRLYRDAAVDGGAPIDEGWVLYIECLVAGVSEPGASGPDISSARRSELPDELRLWLGPFGAPRAVLVVTPDGRVRDDLGALPPAAAEVAAITAGAGAAGGWGAWVKIPASCVDVLADGSHVLRLGVIRRDERGTRTSWPRAMMPWQVEPGRAAVGLDQWTQ